MYGIRMSVSSMSMSELARSTTALNRAFELLSAVRSRTGVRSHPSRAYDAAPVTPSVTNGDLTAGGILIVGWNVLAPRILHELDKWAEPGARVRVLIDGSLVTEQEVAVPGIEKLQISVTSTYNTAQHKVAELCLAEQYERVVVLCYRGMLSAEEADARALMTLLQLRQFRQANPELADRMSVLTEVLDIRDVHLARVAGAEDFIVSERITALMLAQLAEIPDREKVFADLFETWGSELSMRPISYYADPKPGTAYGSYVAAAHKLGHLAIGYRKSGARGKELATAINTVGEPVSRVAAVVAVEVPVGQHAADGRGAGAD